MFPNEPLPIGAVLDRGVALYRNTFKDTVGLAFVVSIPYALVNGLFSYMTAGIGQNPEQVTQLLRVSAVLMPLMYLVLFFLTAAIGHRIAALAREREVSAMADVVFGLKIMLPLSLLAVVYILFMMFGFLFLVVPGMIVGVSMAFYPFVPIMEERGAWGSLWRSHALVWGGNWWRTMAVLGVLSVLGLALAMAMMLIAGGLEVAQASTDGVSLGILTLQALGNLLIMALLTPFGCSAALVVYNDLLLRNDGRDLDLAMSRLEPIALPEGVTQTS